MFLISGFWLYITLTPFAPSSVTGGFFFISNINLDILCKRLVQSILQLSEFIISEWKDTANANFIFYKIFKNAKKSGIFHMISRERVQTCGYFESPF